MLSIHASRLARPMTCAGSLFFKDLPPEETGQAAKEGTAAAEYLERLLLKMDLPTHARNGVYFDNDMKFFAQDLVSEVEAMVHAGINCEQRIDWQTRSGVTIKGRYDMSFVYHGKLYIDDYKYGWGIVEPEGNWQLIAYAIGEVIRLGMAFPTIVMRIHQPRPHHEKGTSREWEITYDQLLDYKEQIESRMDAIVAGEKSLVTSGECKYCPAAAFCPAFGKAFHRGVEVIQDFLQDNIDNTELSFQLDLVSRIEEIIKIRKDSIEQLAADRIKNGNVVPNYISEHRYGHRKWLSTISPEVIRLTTGKSIIEEVMMSPAKAEKVGVPKELMSQMTERPFLGVKLSRKDQSAVGDAIFGKEPPK